MSPGHLGTSKFLVYGLVDPRNGQIRYVGKSSSGLRRPRSHFNNAIKGRDVRTHKANWLRSLAAQGLKPIVTVLVEVQNVKGLSDAERACIAHYRGLGVPLTNLTDGGDGPDGRKNPPETIQRMKLAACRRQGRSEPLDEVSMVNRYLAGLTLRDVAAEFKTTSSVIFRVLKRNQIKIRPRKGMKFRRKCEAVTA